MNTILSSDDTLELVGKGYRLGFCVGESPSWFVVMPNGQSDSGEMDSKLRNAVACIIAARLIQKRKEDYR